MNHLPEDPHNWATEYFRLIIRDPVEGSNLLLAFWDSKYAKVKGTDRDPIRGASLFDLVKKGREELDKKIT